MARSGPFSGWVYAHEKALHFRRPLVYQRTERVHLLRAYERDLPQA